MQQKSLLAYLLIAIALATLVPMVVLGRSEFISYDGYWHLFIDSQNRWRLFLSEYRGDAHPIVYQLLLRFIALFGHSRLVLRSGSILPAAASVFVIGAAALKLCRSQFSALLAAAAYGFSMVMIEIGIDVRSYPLCLLFVLLAFWFFVDLVQGERTERALFGFGIFVSLAIGTEYYALFFLLACLGYIVLLAALQAPFREAVRGWLRQSPVALAIALILPFATIGFFYLTHLKYQPPNYGHVADFYWTPGSSRLEFLLRNLRADLNYMLPLEIGSTAAAAVFFTALVMYAAYFTLLRRGTEKRPVEGLPAFLVVVLLTELAAASLLRRYPFGGFDRQQSIFFPFLVLAAFVLLDQAVGLLPPTWLRNLILCGVALTIAFNFQYRWRRTPRNSEELGTTQYNRFVRNIGPVSAIYVDQFSLIGYYIHTHAWHWKFVRHFREPDRVDEYRLIDSSGRPVFLLRDIDQWNFDLHNPGIYRVLSRSLRDAQINQISVFLLKQVAGHASPAEIRAEEDQVAKLAAAAGLAVRSIYDDNDQAGITFASLTSASPKADSGIGDSRRSMIQAARTVRNDSNVTAAPM